MTIRNEARFIAWTDGSSLTNPGGPGGTGFVIFDRHCSALRFGAQRYLEDPPYAVTNNRMEMRAVLEALEGLPAGATVELRSDSRYLIDALTRWIHGWRRRGWTTADGKPVSTATSSKRSTRATGRCGSSTRGSAATPAT